MGSRPKSMPCCRNAAMNSFCFSGGSSAKRCAINVLRAFT